MKVTLVAGTKDKLIRHVPSRFIGNTKLNAISGHEELNDEPEEEANDKAIAACVVAAISTKQTMGNRLAKYQQSQPKRPSDGLHPRAAASRQLVLRLWRR